MTIEGDEEMDVWVSWVRLFEGIRDFGTRALISSRSVRIETQLTR